MYDGGYNNSSRHCRHCFDLEVLSHISAPAPLEGLSLFALAEVVIGMVVFVTSKQVLPLRPSSPHVDGQRVS